MNCTDLFVYQARSRPEEPALWLPASGVTSYRELLDLAARAQRMLHRSGVRPGTSVLVVEGLGPRLYAIVIAALALGATVVLVEPWMSVERIERVVRASAPVAFVAGPFGWGWGARVPAIRRIPTWRMACRMEQESATSGLVTADVPGETPAIIAFTSGTTGAPKGVVRGQGYLVSQYEALSSALVGAKLAGADLCIFANFVLMNLASGRPSIVVPPRWALCDLLRIDHLPAKLRPVSLTCGPAFLRRAWRWMGLRGLRAIHVGGALADTAWYQRALDKWSNADMQHVYGSSEAEPVAVCDLRDAVSRSRDAGWFQTLLLGAPVPQIASRIESDATWVSGAHVCPLYVGNEEENKLHKQRDEQGRLWHAMGDRIEVRDGRWWYGGRSGQRASDFELEQRLYTWIRSSAAFVHRRRDGELVLVGHGAKGKEALIRRRFPELTRIVACPIVRDRRHRARIDREQTLSKGAPWLLG